MFEQKAKCFYLDGDNILSFEKEYLLFDFVLGDKMRVYYTDKNKLEHIKENLAKVLPSDSKVSYIKCKVGNQKLDNILMEDVKVHKSDYSNSIILSSDKGFDARIAANKIRMVERRGLIGLHTRYMLDYEESISGFSERVRIMDELVNFRSYLLYNSNIENNLRGIAESISTTINLLKDEEFKDVWGDFTNG